MIHVIEDWREQQRQRSRFSVRRIGYTQLRQWTLSQGRLAHETGGFFSVVGLDYRQPTDGCPVGQPFILQPEVGILGFMLHRGRQGPELLVQAKTEPGNPGANQLSPSFQCTESNYHGLHGGEVAPFLEWFTGRHAVRPLADSLQSEQGTRFIDKFNRNVLVEVDRASINLAPEKFAAWRWLPLDAIRQLITRDFLFNTDARSVLATANWADLVADRAPFEPHAATAGYGHELWRSYHADVPSHFKADLVSWLRQRMAAFTAAARICPLDSLPGWVCNDEGIHLSPTAARKKSVAIRYYDVTAHDREVAHWSQPLLTSASPGTVLLLSQVRDGLLRFLVRVSHEPGFTKGAELSAPFQIHPGEPASDAFLRNCFAEWQATTGQNPVLQSCLMSEEGGRFFHDYNRYQLVLAPAGWEPPLDPDLRWLSLAEITAVKTTPGIFTNEMRAAFTLLLPYL